ncbi:hypothetical protein tb265_12010 [Gemmatimonadetes bacterium T265]|nr:hypothetical protein tb265_12010 [Gemmatimonadetes bacterium T265]
MVDPDVPTLPPKFDPEQEDKLAGALLGGDGAPLDDRTAGVLEQLQRQEVRQAAG